MAALGIDFGSSYCTVSWINPQSGKPEAVKFNGDGSVKLPSVLLSTEDGFILGFQAASYLEEINKPGFPYEQRIELMANFIPSLKRNLDPGISEYFYDKEFSHLELLKIFFSYLIDQAKLHCGHGYNIDNICFSHPVDFHHSKVLLIKQAIQEIGYNNVSSIYEPVAAIKGYGIEHKINENDGILVFDYGGGTIDVAFVKNIHGELQVSTPPKGNRLCGGQDIDNLLYENLRTRIKKELQFDISENGIDHTIMSNCRRLKEKFSGANDAYETVILLFVNGKLYQYKYRLSRESFDNIIYPKVCEAINVVKQVVQDIKKKKYNIDKVLLIGGSSRLTLVRQQLSALLENVPVETCGESDIAVALGNIIGDKAITQPITQISIESSISLMIGDNYTLTPTIIPSDGYGTFMWSSDNDDVATISGSGVVSAIGVGSTSIMVKTDNGLTGTCKVIVSAKAKSLNVVYIHDDKGEMHFEWENT